MGYRGAISSSITNMDAEEARRARPIPVFLTRIVSDTPSFCAAAINH
jgi:hypothetical protein